MQNGYFKRDCINKLLVTLKQLLLFINQKVGHQTVKKLLKLQKFDFILIQVTMVPWVLFMMYWVGHFMTFRKFMVFAMIYYNHYITLIEIMKLFMLLQMIKHLLCQYNRLLFKTLKTNHFLTDTDLKTFMQSYDNLIDCIGFFNDGFGLQILGLSILTPLIMVQGFFLTYLKSPFLQLYVLL